MRHFWSPQALGIASLSLAAFVACVDAAADTAPPSLEPAPNYLDIELPLRLGERVIPTTGGECSVVVFAPHDERYERVAAYWQTARWNGYCRFGLAHGAGTITGVEGNWSVETSMVCGLEVNPAESITAETGQDGAISWDPSIDTLNFFSGPAFSDLESKRYVIRLEKGPSGDLQLGDMVSDWYGQDYLEKRTFDENGRERTISISVWNVGTFCGLGLPDEYKSFEKEVKKACKKTADKLVLLRREGFEADTWSDRPITWLKSCPVNRARNINDCGKLVKEALGKEAAELDKFLAEGDAAARAAARQEIFDRYAPLESAIEAPLLVGDFE